MKREAVKAQSQPRRINHWWLAIGVTGAIALLAGVWFFAARENPSRGESEPSSAEATAAKRFSPQRPVTRADLENLQWGEANRLLQTVGTDENEIERLIQLTAQIQAPPAVYLRGLLLMLRQDPEAALATFDTLEPQAIPPAFLYAPHRLQQTLRPGSADPYLAVLRKSVAEGEVPPLIRGRVQALDGDLRKALHSYLRTDPANWTAYDLESLQRIGAHQGFVTDLRRLIVGALASSRVQQTLVAPLQDLARSGTSPPDAEAFKRQLRREIEANTPAGQIAVESARKLISDRNLFVGRKYAELIASHRESEPVQLSTETVLLLFLSAVELKEQIETDRWGLELKRRHQEAEVRDWVNELTGTAR